MKRLPFAAGNDKYRYFELLPDTSELKKWWNQIKQDGLNLISSAHE
jgi:hypothetical protein